MGKLFMGDDYESNLVALEKLGKENGYDPEEFKFVHNLDDQTSLDGEFYYAGDLPEDRVTEILKKFFDEEFWNNIGAEMRDEVPRELINRVYTVHVDAEESEDDEDMDVEVFVIPFGEDEVHYVSEDPNFL